MAVVGLGLMGGSLARALSSLPDAPQVDGWSPEAAEGAAAVATGAVQGLAGRPEEVVAEADLVVYAAPLEATLRMLEEHARLLRGDAVITDVCSLKVPVMDVARTSGLVDRFVGGHPMTGGHRSGFAHGRTDLYRGALVWLVAEGHGAKSALPRVAELWGRLGARPREADAGAHDQLMAWASHLPQAVAWALAATLRASGTDPELLGPGGRDATRLAESPATLWLELLRWNRRVDVAALDALMENIAAVRDALASGDEVRLEAMLAEARAWKAGR